MKDYWVEVTGGTFIQAREKIVEKYGRKWSMQYSDATWNQRHFPKGRYETIEIKEHDNEPVDKV